MQVAGVYKHRPTEVKAAQYDGSVDSSEQLLAWVRTTTGRQRLFAEGDTGLVLQGPDGTYDLYIGDYLKYDNNTFEVVEKLTFEENYEKKE